MPLDLGADNDPLLAFPEFGYRLTLVLNCLCHLPIPPPRHIR